MIEFYKQPKKSAVGQLDWLEMMLGGALPADYRGFLLQTNGGFSNEYEIDFPHWIYPKDETLGVMTWGGIEPEKPFFDMVRSINAIKSSVPAGLLPIAEATSNHLFLLSVRPQDREAVYAYNPELDGDKSLVRVSDTFTSFCGKLRPATD